jgi:hypothetical protein
VGEGRVNDIKDVGGIEGGTRCMSATRGRGCLQSA